jgi:peptidoglycan/xylan/chitin deacetylase (PgdA/CDA1 family)
LAKVKTAMMKAAMSGLYHSRAHRLLAPYTQGTGIIFTLHHVRPEPEAPRDFAPNRSLEVAPQFLDAVLDQVQEAGLDVISLDQAAQRLKEGDDRRFTCFTFDDGYRDNLEYAYPLFKRRGLPLTLYVPADYPDGTGELWWLALEEIVARADEIELCRNGALWRPPASTPAEKTRAYEEIYWWLRMIDEATQRRVVRALAERYDIDMAVDCAKHMMDWDEIRTLAADPLVTIGGHAKGHFAISKLSQARARDEMVGGADCIEQELGSRPVHFAFPYGDPCSAGPRDFALAREAGFKTAVTARKGMLFPAHRRHLTALPRVSLNGDYQSLTYTALYLSGAPFALWNRFRQVDAAYASPVFASSG